MTGRTQRCFSVSMVDCRFGQAHFQTNYSFRLGCEIRQKVLDAFFCYVISVVGRFVAGE